MTVIGIDPGDTTGLAVYEMGKLVAIATVKPFMLFPFLAAYPDAVLVFEDSRQQSAVWGFKDGKQDVSTSVKLRYARNLGQIDGQCRDIDDWTALHGYRVYRVSPKNKGKKWVLDEFLQITGWQSYHKQRARQPSQHEMDAALIAWPFRWTKIVA